MVRENHYMTAKGPIFCDIGITENCLFRCKMCHAWQSPKNDQELSIGEWKDFICALGEFERAPRLHIAGGEPLLKDGIIDLLGFAHARGVTTVMVSNGFLIDRAVALRLAHTGLDVISISLDTLNGTTHDFLRGRPGAHRNALQAVDNLREGGVKSISILAVIMGPTLDDVLSLAEWANENMALSSIYFQAISQPIASPPDPHWRSKGDFAYLWPGDCERVDRVIDGLIRRKKSGYKISNSSQQLESFRSYFRQPQALDNGKKCTQGDYVVYVRPTGEVFLCGSMAPVGDIRKQKIKEIWFSPKAAAIREEIHRCQNDCLNRLNCFEDKELP